MTAVRAGYFFPDSEVNMPSNHSHPARLALVLAAMVLVPALASAIAPTEAPPTIAPVPGFELDVHASTDHFPAGAPEARRPELDRFFDTFSDRWEVRWDRRGDRPHLLQGPGVPILPGRGNDLSGPKPQGVDQVALLVRGILADLPELFRVPDTDLVLDREASGPFQDHFWNIELQQYYQGLPVEGAKVFFRINHGNIVQLGADRVAEIHHLRTTPRLSAEEALAQVLRQAEVPAAEVTPLDDGTLKIFPALPAHELPGQAYVGGAGLGYRHVLAWELTFLRDGDAATYQAVVDAQTGRVLRLVDQNSYARVTGGIFPESNLDTEVVQGMPYCSVTDNGGTHVSDANGYFTAGSGTRYVRLDGQYIDISDSCGTIERSTQGDPALGTSSGTDCTTPGYGGAGNTHAARNAFYHLSLINRQADTYYPSNTWLDGTLTANTNINDACNAYWNGSSVNFFRSGSYYGTTCANTGEISDVMFHEWGHGFDSNTGGPASGDKGSGEAVGDTFAFIRNRNSCLGEGFYTDGTTCDNCGSCSGVRDMGPFSLDGSATLARPTSVEDNGGINCDQWSCPYYGYAGPMGYEGHCESYLASTANWDLARNLVAAYGTEPGWDAMESLWFGSMQSSQSAYRVTSGGQCNTSASIDGCGSNNWYTVFLAVDDDDGNLSNGTPNAGRIWDAYKAHGIACGSTRPDSSDASYTYRLYPYSSSGSSCKRTNTWFNYPYCTTAKEYDVTPGSWIGLYAYGDSCAGCVLYHVNFQIQENYGSGWTTVESHNPPDSKGMVYTTSFQPSTSANGKLRIYAPEGFYLKVFEEGVPNGGFETGSSSPGTGVSGAQPAPTITSNSTYVAARGTYSLGNVGSGTYGGSNSMLWGYNVSVPDFDITASSKLYFDTYGATYSPYSHYHVTVWWTTGGSTTYDNYVCCYNTGIPAGYAQQVFDFPSSAEGKTINKIQISFHKDHSGYSRYKPTIYLDNISLR